MGWERGRYYTRSRKVNGRLVRQYIGSGELGALAAEVDALERKRREIGRAAFQAEQMDLQALDGALDELNDVADLLACAALAAAGFHQHKRGEWRKQRVHRDEDH